MKKLQVIAVIVGIIGICAALILMRTGSLAPIKVVEKKMGPYCLVYESFVGDYKQVGSVFESVQKALAREGIETEQSIGIYYDDPQKVPASQLHSECGSVLASRYLARAKELITKKFKIKVIPPRNSAVVEFPIKGPYSYMIGPIKAYPALRKYCTEKNYQVLVAYEIYDTAAKTITYVLQLKSKQ